MRNDENMKRMFFMEHPVVTLVRDIRAFVRRKPLFLSILPLLFWPKFQYVPVGVVCGCPWCWGLQRANTQANYRGIIFEKL